MKPLFRSSLVAATALAVALSGSVLAYASWTTTAEPSVLRLRTIDMPPGNAPSVAKAPSGKHADLRWVPTRLMPGVKAQSYIVTRIGPGAPVVVCDHVTKAACRDKKVPPGTWTWKVRPVFETWEGADSPASLPLEFADPKQPAPEAEAAADVEAPATGRPAEAHAEPAAPAVTAPKAAPTAEAPEPKTEKPPVTSPPTTAPADPPPTTGADDPADD